MTFQIFTRNFIGKIKNFDSEKDAVAGGAEIYLTQLIQTIKDHYPDSKIEVYQVGEEDITISFADFSITYFKMKNFHKKFFPLFIGNYFNRFLKKEAVKIFNYPNYVPQRKKHEKSISIFHGVEWDINIVKYIYLEVRYKGFLNLFVSPIKYIYFRFYVPHKVKKGICKTTKTISVDNHIFKYIRSKAIQNKVAVIYNCVKIEDFHNTESAISSDNINILVPRNLNVARGVYLIPKAIKILKDKGYNLSVRIVGTGPTQKSIIKEIEKWDLSDEIELVGHVNNREKMAQLYKESDIVIIPTIFSEGTSLSALEGMASKKIVLMTKVGGLKEIGENNVDKIFIDKNSKDISRKIENIILRNYNNKINENAFDRVKEKHNYNDWSKKWIRIIEDISRENS